MGIVLEKNKIVKMLLIFVSSLLIMGVVLPSGQVFAQESDSSEITRVTNTKKYIESLTKENKELTEEIKELSKQGYKIEDESFIIEDVKIITYSNEDKTTQGFIQVRDGTFTILEASVYDDGTYKSGFLKDNEGEKVSLDSLDKSSVPNAEMQNGGATTFRSNPSTESIVCSILVNFSGTSITAIYTKVLAAIGTGPAGMAALAALSVLGWGYVGAYC